MSNAQLSLELDNGHVRGARTAGDLPSGLTFEPDALTPAAEDDLLAAIDAREWQTSLSRRVQHYGWRYDYKARRVDPAAYLGRLPSFLEPLIALVAAHGMRPDQAIINEYEPGQGIAAHIDCIPCFGAQVAMVSLGSAVQMDFHHAATGRRGSIEFSRRGLLIASDEARYEWTHAIAKRRSDPLFAVRRSRRVSVTFRTIIAADAAAT